MNDIREKLADLARGNAEYAVFNKRIVNTGQEVLGVRLPDMRKLARELARGMTVGDARDFIKSADKKVYEEVLLIGLVIAYAKLTDVEKVELTKQYLKHVDSWAQIDSATMRTYGSDVWWDFAKECLRSDEEFTVRYGVILMMDNFLTDAKLAEVLQLTSKIKNDAYYVKMGVVWLYAEAGLKNYEKTIASVTKLEPWTQRKALTKMLESYRFTADQNLHSHPNPNTSIF
jgi:3-methyladenine DNA glycosylase AlkD